MGIKLPTRDEHLEWINRSRDDQVSLKVGAIQNSFWEPTTDYSSKISCCSCSNTIYESNMTFCQYKQLVSGSHHEVLGFYLSAEWTPELIEFMDTRHPFLRSAQVLSIRLSMGCLLCQGLICPSCVSKSGRVIKLQAQVTLCFAL